MKLKKYCLIYHLPYKSYGIFKYDDDFTFGHFINSNQTIWSKEGNFPTDLDKPWHKFCPKSGEHKFLGYYDTIEEMIKDHPYLVGII